MEMNNAMQFMDTVRERFKATPDVYVEFLEVRPTHPPTYPPRVQSSSLPPPTHPPPAYSSSFKPPLPPPSHPPTHTTRS